MLFSFSNDLSPQQLHLTCCVIIFYMGRIGLIRSTVSLSLFSRKTRSLTNHRAIGHHASHADHLQAFRIGVCFLALARQYRWSASRIIASFKIVSTASCRAITRETLTLAGGAEQLPKPMNHVENTLTATCTEQISQRRAVCSHNHSLLEHTAMAVARVLSTWPGACGHHQRTCVARQKLTCSCRICICCFFSTSRAAKTCLSSSARACLLALSRAYRRILAWAHAEPRDSWQTS